MEITTCSRPPAPVSAGIPLAVNGYQEQQTMQRRPAMEKGQIGNESANKRSTEWGAPAGRTWDEIGDEAFKLSHLVQAGRRVSKEQLLEVECQFKGPPEILRK
jgi:hypothetical protein